MIDKYYGQYTPYCDFCDETLPGEMTFEDAKEAIRAAGWKTVNTSKGWKNYCPDCAKEIAKQNKKAADV